MVVTVKVIVVIVVVVVWRPAKGPGGLRPASAIEPKVSCDQPLGVLLPPPSLWGFGRKPGRERREKGDREGKKTETNRVRRLLLLLLLQVVATAAAAVTVSQGRKGEGTEREHRGRSGDGEESDLGFD